MVFIIGDSSHKYNWNVYVNICELKCVYIMFLGKIRNVVSHVSLVLLKMLDLLLHMKLIRKRLRFYTCISYLYASFIKQTTWFLLYGHVFFLIRTCLCTLRTCCFRVPHIFFKFRTWFSYLAPAFSCIAHILNASHMFSCFANVFSCAWPKTNMYGLKKRHVWQPPQN